MSAKRNTTPYTRAENQAAGERVRAAANSAGITLIAFNLERSKDRVLATALIVAQRDGLARLTRAALARALGASENLVTYHFPTMPQLKRDMMRAAIRCGVLRVVGEGVAARDRHALKAPDALKAEALKSLAA